MKVDFAPTTRCNGTDVHESENILEVTIDGKFWGWVAGPSKGQRPGKTGWMALPGTVVNGEQVADRYSWCSGNRNREAAVLAAYRP